MASRLREQAVHDQEIGVARHRFGATREDIPALPVVPLVQDPRQQVDVAAVRDADGKVTADVQPNTRHAS